MGVLMLAIVLFSQAIILSSGFNHTTLAILSLLVIAIAISLFIGLHELIMGCFDRILAKWIFVEGRQIEYASFLDYKVRAATVVKKPESGNFTDPYKIKFPDSYQRFESIDSVYVKQGNEIIRCPVHTITTVGDSSAV